MAPKEIPNIGKFCDHKPENYLNISCNEKSEVSCSRGGKKNPTCLPQQEEAPHHFSDSMQYLLPG